MANPVTWVPEQLVGELFRPGWLHGDGEVVEPAPEASRNAEVDAAAVQWLSRQIHDAVERSRSVREVLLQGRELRADDVMRVRSLHRGVHLRHELQWAGPHQRVENLLTRIAGAQHALLRADGDGARELRFRIRLQSMDLELALLSYAATEFVDPQIIDPQLALDVLAYSDADMPVDVIVRLGMMRAWMDEVETSSTPVDVRDVPDSREPVVHRAWQAHVANAKHVADTWAKRVIVTRRQRDRYR